MYKWFKDKEIVGLDPELCRMLDNARTAAKVPFIITSGYRTPAHSIEIGGTGSDAHTRHLAADISAIGGEQHYAIVYGALVAGFKRIGVGTRHIHLDIDLSLPNPAIFPDQ